MHSEKYSSQSQQSRKHAISLSSHPPLHRLPPIEFPSVRGTLLSHALAQGLLFSSYESIKSIGFNTAHMFFPESVEFYDHKHKHNSHSKNQVLNKDAIPLKVDREDKNLSTFHRDGSSHPSYHSSTFYSIVGVVIVATAGGCAGMMEELSSHFLSSWEKEGIMSLRQCIAMNGMPRTTALVSSVFPTAIGMIAYEYGKDTFEENK